jgi:hypothetical protein
MVMAVRVPSHEFVSTRGLRQTEEDSPQMRRDTENPLTRRRSPIASSLREPYTERTCCGIAGVRFRRVGVIVPGWQTDLWKWSDQPLCAQIVCYQCRRNRFSPHSRLCRGRLRWHRISRRTHVNRGPGIDSQRESIRRLSSGYPIHAAKRGRCATHASLRSDTRGPRSGAKNGVLAGEFGSAIGALASPAK